MVFGLLLLLFLAVPIVELFVLVRVAGQLGLPETLLLMVAVSVVGAWMVKQQGLGILRRTSTLLAQGEIPGRELVDALLLLVAGALLLTPGFVTDGVGLALLLPPVRTALRAWAARSLRARVHTSGFTVVDAEAWNDDDPPSSGRKGLGPI